MSTWLYLFTEKRGFPEPLAEISALKAIDEENDAFLMLANRVSPPGSKAVQGDRLALCTRTGGIVYCHALAKVSHAPKREATTPQAVDELYGPQSNRFFIKLSDFEMTPQDRATDVVPQFTTDDQAKWQKGRGFVKLAGARSTLGRRNASQQPPLPLETLQVPYRFDLRLKARRVQSTPVVVMGLDPTAGTWSSQMMSGPKKMPSVRLNVSVSGETFTITWGGIDLHQDNQSFIDCVNRHNASCVCIDGPCDTNGLGCLPDWSDWDRSMRGGVRDGERDLARKGIGLFWTTFGTVTRFDGASRWIARSLRLFGALPQSAASAQIIETHPHAAFTLLWRACGRADVLPKKTTTPGQNARLAMLRTFISQLDEAALNNNHDRIDAACAALVAALHIGKATRPFGTVACGGVIWVPDERSFE